MRQRLHSYRWARFFVFSIGVVYALTFAPVRGVALAPDTPRHLYVLDIAKRVYTYPLVRGLPAAQADGVLQLPALPVGMAHGPDGFLYVAVYLQNGSSDVVVYQPRARGNARPARVLHMPTQCYASPLLALDSEGYMYVQCDVQAVYVFAPRASGHDQPNSVVIGSPTSLAGMAVDERGLLYIADYAAIRVFDNPRTAPHQIREILPTSPSDAFGGPLALWDGELYVGYYPNNQPNGAPDFAAMPDTAHGPTPAKRHIIAYGCNYLTLVQGTVVHRGYMYVACRLPNAVFVYGAFRGGEQQPRATLSGPFGEAIGVDLGP